MTIMASAPVAAGSRLIDAPTADLLVIPRPRRACPIIWCAGCDRPDPGVTVHLSRTWTGADRFDGARWWIQVTQRHTPTGVLPAVVDVTGVEGTFGSLLDMADDLLAADALAKRINAGGAR